MSPSFCPRSDKSQSRRDMRQARAVSYTHLPKNIKENSVCYTGTHDNDTLLGYINKLKGRELRNFKNSLEEVLKDADIAYPLQNKKEMAQAILYLTMKSKAFLAVLPIQDILLLDSRARMNLSLIHILIQ